jgi:hypothetical protein
MSPRSNRHPESSEADETTSLITAADSDATTLAGPHESDALLKSSAGASNGTFASNGTPSASPPEEDEDQPLPKLQIFLLSCCRFIEPIAFFSIFPFINQMIEETGGVDEKRVGFYSGLIVRT